MSGIDACSSVPLFITMKFGDQVLSSATAFLWFTHNRYFLITNWHNVSGRNNETDECISKKGGIPDRIIVHFPKLERHDPPTEIEIRTLDSDSNPRWTEHPIYAKSVDVIAIHIEPPSPSNHDYFAINRLPMMNLKQRIGMPLYILGFPFGRSAYGMPVWKQGSFASEPFMSPQYDKHLIVDSASRPGMSGAPVIQRVYGHVELDDHTLGPTNNRNGALRFVGVYSGRFHTQEQEDAQLGRVWPEQLVQEIVEHAALWTPPD